MVVRWLNMMADASAAQGGNDAAHSNGIVSPPNQFKPLVALLLIERLATQMLGDQVNAAQRAVRVRGSVCGIAKRAKQGFGADDGLGIRRDCIFRRDQHRAAARAVGEGDTDLRAATVTLLDAARRMGKRIGTSRGELQGALQIRLQDANLRLRAPAVAERGVRMFINQRRNLGIAQRVHDSRKFCFVLARPEEDRGIGANSRRIERGDQRRSAGGALNHALTVFGLTEWAEHGLAKASRAGAGYCAPTATRQRSTATATALPPPRHRAAMPRLRLRRCNS